MLIALTRSVSPSLARCEITHRRRVPIDVALAEAQHDAYERLLATLGATVVRAPAAPDLPDAVFIEDTAVVLDEVAIVTIPGAPSRRGETAGVAPLLARYRPVLALAPPAMLDGGDVLRLGRDLYVGRSSRTNSYGIEQLRELAAPSGYRVNPVGFAGCLHLKSAVTAVTDGLLLHNPEWVSAEVFRGQEALPVDGREPHGANALRIADSVLYPSQFPRTRDRLLHRGLSVESIDCSELAKAEGAVTCCSLLFEAPAAA